MIEIPFPNVIFLRMIFHHGQFFEIRILNVAAKYLHIWRQCIRKRLPISIHLYSRGQLHFDRLLRKCCQALLLIENMSFNFFGNWCKLPPSSLPFLFEIHLISDVLVKGFSLGQSDFLLGCYNLCMSISHCILF